MWWIIDMIALMYEKPFVVEYFRQSPVSLFIKDYGAVGSFQGFNVRVERCPRSWNSDRGPLERGAVLIVHFAPNAVYLQMKNGRHVEILMPGVNTGATSWPLTSRIDVNAKSEQILWDSEEKRFKWLEWTMYISRFFCVIWAKSWYAITCTYSSCSSVRFQGQ